MESNLHLDDHNLVNEIYFSKPSLILRIKSIFINSIVIIVLIMIVSQILTQLNVESGIVRGLFLALIVLYEPILTAYDRTISQKMMGLRVRSFSELNTSGQSKNIEFGWSLLGFVIKTLLGCISLLMILLMIHSNDYGKAIHDSVANSAMTLEK